MIVKILMLLIIWLSDLDNNYWNHYRVERVRTMDRSHGTSLKRTSYIPITSQWRRNKSAAVLFK